MFWTSFDRAFGNLLWKMPWNNNKKKIFWVNSAVHFCVFYQDYHQGAVKHKNTGNAIVTWIPVENTLRNIKWKRTNKKMEGKKLPKMENWISDCFKVCCPCREFFQETLHGPGLFSHTVHVFSSWASFHAHESCPDPLYQDTNWRTQRVSLPVAQDWFGIFWMWPAG